MAYQNFYASKLQNEIGSSDTSIVVQTPPTVTSGRLVLEPRNPQKREIIRYTGVAGTSLTGVIRGQGGTLPQSHLSGSIIQMNVTAEDLDDALNINGNLVQYTDELLADNIVPGTGIVAVVSGLTVSISNIVYYMGGVRLTKNSIPNKVLTATKDTYCFIDTAGTITYSEVTVGAASPATPANSILFAVITTNGSTATVISLRGRGAVKKDTVDWGTMGMRNFAGGGNSITVTAPFDCVFDVTHSRNTWGNGGGIVAWSVNSPAGLTTLFNQEGVTEGHNTQSQQVIARRVFTGGIKGNSYTFTATVVTGANGGGAGATSMLVTATALQD